LISTQIARPETKANHGNPSPLTTSREILQGVVHKAKRRGDSYHVAIKQVFLSTMSKKDQVPIVFGGVRGLGAFFVVVACPSSGMCKSSLHYAGLLMITSHPQPQAEAAHEVRVLSQLNHPNVIKYLDSFNEGSTLLSVPSLHPASPSLASSTRHSGPAADCALPAAS